jgi:hypothetical protein
MGFPVEGIGFAFRRIAPGDDAPDQLLAVLVLGEHADQHPTLDGTQGDALPLVLVAERAVVG